MKRYHQELGRTKRTHRLHLRWTHNWPKEFVDWDCELQAGRFRKQKARGCRKARCIMCHYGKIFKIATEKDHIREEKFRDSLKDYKESKAEGRE